MSAVLWWARLIVGYYVSRKSKAWQMKKTENRQKGRLFCTSSPGKGLFSLRGRATCISVPRFSYWEVEAPEEGHGCSSGAAGIASQSLPHVTVFYGVRPSAEGTVSAACFAVPGCPPLPNIAAVSARWESPTYSPLLHAGDWAGPPTLQQAEGIHNFPLPFFLPIVPKAGSNALT